MTELLTLPEVLLCWLILTVSSTLHGAVGVGGGLIAVPLLALIDPGLVPGSALFASLLLTSLMVIRERRAVDLFGIKWGIAGRIGGTLIATCILTTLPARETALVIGGLILLAVVLSISGLDVKRTEKTLIGAGVLSGIMGTLSSVGGPPMALLYQDAPGAKVRATLSGFFIFGSIISLIALILTGWFGWIEALSSIMLMPGVGLGFLLSTKATRLLDRGYVRAAILVVSATSAIVLTLKQSI